MSATFSRRSLLLTAPLLGLTASACEVRSPLEQPPAPTPRPIDPDLALRDSVRTAIVVQVQLLAAVARSHPSVAGRAGPLTAMHREHLKALPGEEAPALSSPRTTPSGPSTPPAQVQAAWARALAGEASLQKQLADAAQSAESGPFARLLASMAAAIGQRVSP